MLETLPVDDVADDGLGERLERLLPLVAEDAAEASEARRPSQRVMTAAAEAGLLRLIVPKAYGGLEVSPRAFLEIVRRIAEVDGSTAWTVMTCNEEAGIASAYLEPSSIAEHVVSCPATIVAGSGVPKGRAEAVDDGWRITGRWDFVSGCTAADRVVLASVVADTEPVKLCFVLVPTADVTIEDTWHTHGLRGTGSNDVVLDGHLVPHRWAGVIDAFALPRPDTPFYRLPSPLRFPFPKVGVATGIARAAIDEFRSLAAGKRPLHSKGQLAERPSAQAAMASAEAQVSAGLALVREVLSELWEVAEQASATTRVSPIEPELHARCRLACSYAVDVSIQSIEQLLREAGTTANARSSPLAQLLLDARAVAGHFMVGPYQINTAGRVLLGLDPLDRQF